MPWFKVDDSFGTDPKVLGIPRRDRMAAVGLWTLAGTWCMQQLTDGYLDRHMVGELGGSDRQAQALVDAGLWEASDLGFRFHDWSDWQPTKEAVEAERAAARERMRRMRSPELRRSSGEVPANFKRSSPEVRQPSVRDPRPDPSRPVLEELMAGEVSHLQVNGAPGDSTIDLETIARATRGDHAHARRVARDVLSKAKAPPSDPTAYVLTAVRDDPARHRSSAPTAVARCREHDIELPCGACAADRKVEQRRKASQ